MEEGGTDYQLYVGIDVAAETFVSAWLAPGGKPGTPVTGEQTPAGFAALQRCLRATAVSPAATLVVLEATGNYWVALAVALHEAGYRVAVVNPRQAHHFAKAQLRRAKTDALDARDLARLAAALRPTPWTPPPAVYHEVRQRLVARDGLLAMRTQARNQRHALLQWPVVVAAVCQHLDELIADLDRRVAALEAEITAVLTGSVWAESLLCLTSAPGIGLVTASWLLVGTLNFALCAGPEALTAYAGLAPVPRESGRSIRGRAQIGHDGNARLRTALYMATLSAARYNPAIRVFYQRLRAAGKPEKVARCAAARKLLHQAWALGSRLQRFDPRYQQHEVGQSLAA
jgi:transposase